MPTTAQRERMYSPLFGVEWAIGRKPTKNGRMEGVGIVTPAELQYIKKK
jgi:hypothetical protein